jgi:hypothetical protein
MGLKAWRCGLRRQLATSCETLQSPANRMDRKEPETGIESVIHILEREKSWK